MSGLPELSCQPGVAVQDFAAECVRVRHAGQPPHGVGDFIAIHNDRRVRVGYSTTVESFLNMWEAIGSQPSTPTHVSIPRDVAEALAEVLRGRRVVGDARAREYAEMLDPTSLRRAVSDTFYGDGQMRRRIGDNAAAAVLPVIASWLASQPLATSSGYLSSAWRQQRDHDLSLLRGAS